MMRSSWLVAATPCFCLLMGVSALAEEVENPQYRSWARVKTGTVIRVRTTSATPQGDIVSTFDSRLVTLDDRKAEIETWGTVRTGTGEITKIQPYTYPIRRMVPVPPGMKHEDVGQAPNALARGEEVLTLGAKTYSTQWYDLTGPTERGLSRSRTWITEDVPGLVLKSVTTVPGTDKVTTVELIAIQSP